MERGSDDDRNAIMRVIEAETAAYFNKDFEGWARCWVQEPYVRRWMWFGQGGITVREGWDQQGPAMKQAMENSPAPNASVLSVRRENVNVRLGRDMAWVTFDQHAPKTGDAFDVPGLQNELRVLEKHAGEWKLACICVLQRSFDYVSFPLLRVDANACVTWMNPAAEIELGDGESLAVRSGRLRAVDRNADQRLQAAIRWAASLDEGPAARHSIPNAAWQGSLPVIIGGGHGEAATVCWVMAESDMILVSINDQRIMEERLRAAAVVYGITPAQQRLAGLIIAGHDLVAAAERLGVSVNTVRTHLQRMFDKTGVRSQPALVRALLSVGSPRSWEIGRRDNSPRVMRTHDSRFRIDPVISDGGFPDRRRRIAMTLFRALAFAAVAWVAASPANAEEVDVQLVLAADVSGSMSSDELRVQRDGYAAALRSNSVFRAVLSGALGRAALTYIEWAGIDEQLVVVPWTVVGSRADLAIFADEVAFGSELSTTPRGRGTSLSFALLFAARLFDNNGLSSLGRVIDVSGDGDNNDGPPMAETRDAIVSRGITINGISVALTDAARYGPYAYVFQSSHEKTHQYYVENVIGGQGAFAMAVNTLDDFADTMERKLVLEIARARPDPAHATHSVALLDE